MTDTTDPFAGITNEKCATDWLNMAEDSLDPDTKGVYSPGNALGTYKQILYYLDGRGLTPATRARVGHARYTIFLPATILSFRGDIQSTLDFRAHYASEGHTLNPYPSDTDTWRLNRIRECEDELAEWETAGRPFYTG